MITQLPDMDYFENGIPKPSKKRITPTRSDQQIPKNVFMKTIEKIVEEPGASDSPETPLVGTTFPLVNNTVTRVLGE